MSKDDLGCFPPVFEGVIETDLFDDGDLDTVLVVFFGGDALRATCPRLFGDFGGLLDLLLDDSDSDDERAFFLGDPLPVL